MILWRTVALLVALPASTTALAPTINHKINGIRQRGHPSTCIARVRSTRAPIRTTPVASAKVIPVAYTAAGGTLLYHAATTASTASLTYRAVLAAVGILSVVDLSPTVNRQFASYKRALDKFPPASSGPEKQQRQAALTWKRCVRIKLIGQVCGLFWAGKCAADSNTAGVLRGIGVVMWANVCFWLAGAGAARHDDDGTPAPLQPQLVRTIAIVDLLLLAAAVLGARADPDTARRAVCSMILVGGCAGGILENTPKFFRALTSSK